MKPNDYYGHYKAFVKALSENPSLRLQQYCRENNVIWRRLYDWMNRKQISLKRLYEAYGSKNMNCAMPVADGSPQFCELLPIQKVSTPTPAKHEPTQVGLSRIMLPSGVVMELKDCPVSALTILLNQCMGKEVGNVCS